MTEIFPFWTQEDAYYTKKQELINENKRELKTAIAIKQERSIKAK